MFIICKYPQVLVNDQTYNNRRINLRNIVMFDKSKSKSRSNNREVLVPSIKFTSIITNNEGKGEIFEWLFESIEQRDDAFEDIDKQLAR